MKFGYARVSKDTQDLEVQIQRLKEVGCDEIFMEKVSGAKEDRSELSSLLHKLRKGDTICVVRIDRLGRRMLQLVTMINDFKQKGVNFVSLDNHIDTSTPIGMAIFNICASFADMERELIRERVRAGIKAAYKKGRKGGRPKILTPDKIDTLNLLRKTGQLPVSKVCKLLNISRSSYYRFAKDFEK